MSSTGIGARGHPEAKRHCQGMSLLETLIGLSLSMILLTSMFALYYGAARGAAKDATRAEAGQESRMAVQRLSRDFKLVGLLATNDCNGDSDDVNRDVPLQIWSDSIRSDFEYANTYEVVFTGDIDNDGFTETVKYARNATHSTIIQTTWQWSRDSLEWEPPVARTVATHVDYVLFTYYDRDGNTLPNPMVYLSGGYTLTMGERARVTAVEISVVTRSDRQENGNPQFVYLPDGAYWYDGYQRTINRFMVRGRNLSLGA